MYLTTFCSKEQFLVSLQVAGVSWQFTEIQQPARVGVREINTKMRGFGACSYKLREVLVSLKKE